MSQSPSTAKTEVPAAVSENKLSYEAQKELNKKIRKLEKQIADCEKEIEDLEGKKTEIETRMATPEGAADMKLYEQYQQLKEQISEVEDRWEAVSLELEEIKE